MSSTGSFTHGEIWCLKVLVFMIMFAALLTPMISAGRFYLPPEVGDGQDYDSLGLNLARGRGFGFWWDDPEWREPYAASNGDGRYNVILERKGAYQTTAYRAPTLPFFLSLIYLTLGRRFFIWRIANCAIFALAVTLAVDMALRLTGSMGALWTLVLALMDRQLGHYAELYLTEGLALLGVAALTYVLILLGEQNKLFLSFAAGAILGVLALTRTIFIIWYPFMALLIFWLWGWKPKERLEHHTRVAFAVFLAGALLVPMPWWVRNCIVLKSFMPLGTQGGIYLPVAFSDRTLRETRGHWWNPSEQDAAGSNSRGGEWLNIDEERERAKAGATEGLNWIVANLYRIPEIVLDKIFQEWRLRSRYQAVLFAFAGLGIALGLTSVVAGKSSVILAVLLVINSVAIAGTWSADGRYLFPLHPVLYVLAALGLRGMVQRVWPKTERIGWR